ncbi:MAG: hypothetical protein IIC24_10245, partial [Chloroflexi bacterium]|nr:hypothetical protein [Chloroflexota bacterium]
MTFENTLNLVTAVGAILVPIAVLVIGQLFRSSQERSNRARREVDQLANFIGHLSSDNSTRRKLAYVALKHIREQDQVLAALLDVMTNISMSA